MPSSVLSVSAASDIPSDPRERSDNVLANFKNIGTLSNPNNQPPTSFNDGNVKNGSTYTYFVTDNNALGVQSPRSNLLTVTVKY